MQEPSIRLGAPQTDDETDNVTNAVGELSRPPGPSIDASRGTETNHCIKRCSIRLGRNEDVHIPYSMRRLEKNGEARHSKTGNLSGLSSPTNPAV